MSLSSFFSTFFETSTVHCDAPAQEEPKEQEEEVKEEAASEEPEEEEEEEIEDILPALQEECAQTAKCAPAASHFAHCEEKVNDGKGFQHEDCVEEFYHLMHCVNGCVAPKLFSQLK